MKGLRVLCFALLCAGKYDITFFENYFQTLLLNPDTVTLIVQSPIAKSLIQIKELRALESYFGSNMLQK